MADWPPLKAASFAIILPLYDATGALIKGAAGLAACISTDLAAFGAATCTVTEMNASAGLYYLKVASGEANGDVVAWKVTSSTASAKEAVGAIYTVTRQLDDLLYAGYPMTELGQAQPSATPTVEQALMFHYMTLRNTASTTTGCILVTNDAGTVVWKAAISDSASVFERTKWVAGP